MIISGKDSDFFTETPTFFTCCGKEGMASDTRFCVSTFALSRSVPTSKLTFSVKLPSLALVDFM